MKKVIAGIVLTLTFIGAVFANGEIDSPAVMEERVAIISAYGPEVVKLKSAAKIEAEVIINGRSFTLCEIAGKKALIFMSGISMVNAAMTTQMAFDHFNISHILFSGIAGGVNPDLNIGDVTIPAKRAHQVSGIHLRPGNRRGLQARLASGDLFRFRHDVSPECGAHPRPPG